jgi:hypothetical protein
MADAIRDADVLRELELEHSMASDDLRLREHLTAVLLDVDVVDLVNEIRQIAAQTKIIDAVVSAYNDQTRFERRWLDGRSCTASDRRTVNVRHGSNDVERTVGSCGRRAVRRDQRADAVGSAEEPRPELTMGVLTASRCAAMR